MSREFENIDERLDYIEFRQTLLFNNSDLSRLIFEYEITEYEYQKIMDLMDEIKDRLENGEEVLHDEFEQEIYNIVPLHKRDYHFCEYIARAFMDDGRWGEVFPALYGDMPKYKYIGE